MKDYRNLRPSFLVPMEKFIALRDRNSHVFETPLTKNVLKYLPPAYESAVGTILVFPSKECPKKFYFRTKECKEKCSRDVMNIMAYKLEDGSEIIKVRFK